MKILITESQLRTLILEQQKIKVTDFCGRTKEVDYQQWYYGITKEYPYGSNGGQQASYVKCYKGAGTSFVFNDWGCEFRNWSTMTERERNIAIEGKKQAAGCGSADRFGIAAALKEVITFENVVDILSIVLGVIPQTKPIGKAIDVAQAVAYFIRFALSTKVEDVSSNFINGVFQTISLVEQIPTVPLPGFVGKKINYLVSLINKNLDKVGNFIEGGAMWFQIVIAYISDFFGGNLADYVRDIISKLLKPIMDFVAQYNSYLFKSLSNVIQQLQSMINNINNGILFGNKVKSLDQNAFK